MGLPTRLDCTLTKQIQTYLTKHSQFFQFLNVIRCILVDVVNFFFCMHALCVQVVPPPPPHTHTHPNLSINPGSVSDIVNASSTNWELVVHLSPSLSCDTLHVLMCLCVWRVILSCVCIHLGPWMNKAKFIWTTWRHKVDPKVRKIYSVSWLALTFIF